MLNVKIYQNPFYFKSIKFSNLKRVFNQKKVFSRLCFQIYQLQPSEFYVYHYFVIFKIKLKNWGIKLFLNVKKSLKPESPFFLGHPVCI